MTSTEPIRQTTVVRSSPEHTFEVFVRRLGDWWPTQPFSLDADSVIGVSVTPRVGGEVVEHRSDGSTAFWGRVLTWDPPNRFAMTWEVFAGGTEVELSFIALGPELTRVELVHRGWEQLDEDAVRTATAMPGGYAAGWRVILGCFDRFVAEAETSSRSA